MSPAGVRCSHAASRLMPRRSRDATRRDWWARNVPWQPARLRAFRAGSAPRRQRRPYLLSPFLPRCSRRDTARFAQSRGPFDPAPRADGLGSRRETGGGWQLTRSPAGTRVEGTPAGRPMSLPARVLPDGLRPVGHRRTAAGVPDPGRAVDRQDGEPLPSKSATPAGPGGAGLTMTVTAPWAELPGAHRLPGW
jgi:hypothetical protein